MTTKPKKRPTLRQQVERLEKENLGLRCDNVALTQRFTWLESRYLKEVGDRDRQINSLNDRVCDLQRGDISETVCGLRLRVKRAEEESTEHKRRLDLANARCGELEKRERTKIRRAKQATKRKTKKR